MSIFADMDQEWAEVRDWAGEQSKERLGEIAELLNDDDHSRLTSKMLADPEFADNICWLALIAIGEGVMRYGSMKCAEKDGQE